MSKQSLVCGILAGMLVGVSAGADKPGTPLKVYINTDLEGASGVYKFAQTRERGTPLYEEACRYLMGDIAAVVRGLRDAGVQEILVLDGHGLQAFLPDHMEPGAKYITGIPRPEILWGLQGSAGQILLAFHAMMGTPDGALCHTQSSRSENRYWYNGVESGEIVQSSAIGGHYGIPTIMVTGDEATCREARKFLGPDCITVATKRGLARESAALYPFQETRKALYEGAKQAVAALPRCKPFTMPLPIKAKRQWFQLDAQKNKGKLMTKEGEVRDLLHILDF